MNWPRVRRVLLTELVPLRYAADDHEDTERLKALFSEHQLGRRPFYLTADDLEEVFRWKLQGQYGRNRDNLARNTEPAYRTVTEAAFRMKDSDLDYEAEVRIGILSSLPGVGIGIASAILALVDPARYCVIDWMGWRVLFEEEKRGFTVKDYLRYLGRVRELAEELGWSPQEVDLAIWEFENRKSLGG